MKMFKFIKRGWALKLSALAFVAILLAPIPGNSAIISAMPEDTLYVAIAPGFGATDFTNTGVPDDSSYYGLDANGNLVTGPTIGPYDIGSFITITTTHADGNTYENAWLQSRYAGRKVKTFLDNQNASPTVEEAMEDWFGISLEYRVGSSCAGCDVSSGDGTGTSIFSQVIDEDDNVNFVFVHLGTQFLAYMFDPSNVLTSFSVDGLDMGVSNIYSYDWPQTSVIPLPAALPLYGTGLAVIGFIGWRKKRKTEAT